MTTTNPNDPIPDELHRLPAESARVYQHFLAYLALGPRRSLHKLALHLGIDERHCERLSTQHRWVARARQFDALRERDALRALLHPSQA